MEVRVATDVCCLAHPRACREKNPEEAADPVPDEIDPEHRTRE